MQSITDKHCANADDGVTAAAMIAATIYEADTAATALLYMASEEPAATGTAENMADALSAGTSVGAW